LGDLFDEAITYSKQEQCKRIGLFDKGKEQRQSKRRKENHKQDNHNKTITSRFHHQVKTNYHMKKGKQGAEWGERREEIIRGERRQD
jgi:hypothetical protein